MGLNELMNYLLTMRLLLAATVLIHFFIKYFNVWRHKSSSGGGRLGLIILTSVLLYGGVLMASINKLSYWNVLVTAGILLAACFILEVGLQQLAKRLARPNARPAFIRYFG
jgi:hypothetical protein